MDIEEKITQYLMKPGNKRGKIAKITLYRIEYKVETRGLRDRYADEGIVFYPLRRRGFKNPHKRLYPNQVRMYRNWKYNRKTQWKNGERNIKKIE